ncbi:hypothetical protein EN851_07880 [Mesorhizobium sp. M8A.F.Ca.ET.208.01.1.1]|uniref:hypothetical protein n=1 Tax=unclassified Mesorhizobium TaxID=325217 RepID=UPI001093DAF3|nr:MULTISPECIES: hypothetical protein [unclassified Mesorhizobium]TGQ95428.1 hypothetical protein EN851_07880 [Mesorhizobium sp. M8A.F.Ca.ET.208.01.1.1]TGT55919.1 hypothetical protein EN810_07880 [Mesorhizobium sp. M8A.F.Ca.ET.167.01.1.1]
MMPGIAAQPLVRRFGGGIDPADILADLDFLAETYAIHGASAVAADFIDKPGRVGASGLEILDNDVDGVVSAIGELLTDFLTMDWTIVIEWQELTTDGATYLLYMFEAPGGDNHWLVIERSTAFTGLRVDAHEGSNITRHVEINTSHGPGVHKIAVTRTNGFLSISCDGSAVDTVVATPIMNPMATASFGGDPTDQSYNGTFIRKVKLMTPQADALLPALSA